MTSSFDMFSSVVQQAPNSKDYILTQYDLLEGDVATEANEIMIVVNGATELTDVLLTITGYYTQDEFMNIAYRATKNGGYDATLDKKQFTYEELVGKEFVYYPNDVVYSETNFMTVPFKHNYKKDSSFTEGTNLKVAGILRPKANINYGCLTSGFYYTTAFTQKFLKDSMESKLLKYMDDNSLWSFNATFINGNLYPNAND